MSWPRACALLLAFGGTAAAQECAGPPAPVSIPAARCRAWGAPVRRATVADPVLDEISGAAVSTKNPGLIWVLEDSSDDLSVPSVPVVYAIDREGRTRAAITLTGATNVDWEDLAIGPCPSGSCLFVGDIGDNDGLHPSYAVYRFPEPPVSGTAALAVTPERFEFVYPDGPRDAESLFVGADGVPRVVTKRNARHLATIFRLPALDRSHQVTAVPERRFATNDGPRPWFDQPTAADATPDGRTLFVRTYGQVLSLDLADPHAAPRVLPTADEPQGESIAFDPIQNGYWQISEGPHAPLWFTPCLR